MLYVSCRNPEHIAQTQEVFLDCLTELEEILVSYATMCSNPVYYEFTQEEFLDTMCCHKNKSCISCFNMEPVLVIMNRHVTLWDAVLDIEELYFMYAYGTKSWTSCNQFGSSLRYHVTVYETVQYAMYQHGKQSWRCSTSMGRNHVYHVQKWKRVCISYNHMRRSHGKHVAVWEAILHISIHVEERT